METNEHCVVAVHIVDENNNQLNSTETGEE